MFAVGPYHLLMLVHTLEQLALTQTLLPPGPELAIKTGLILSPILLIIAVQRLHLAVAPVAIMRIVFVPASIASVAMARVLIATISVPIVAHVFPTAAFRLLVAEPGANLVACTLEEAAIPIVISAGLALGIRPAGRARSIVVGPIVEAVAAIIAGIAAAAIISVVTIGAGAAVVPAIPAAIGSAALGLCVTAIASVRPIAALIALVTHRNLLHFS
jgi:hypothetical protein